MTAVAGHTDFLIVDADTHLSEPWDLWTRNAPARYKDRVPQVRDVDGEPSWVFDGVTISPARAACVIDSDMQKQLSSDWLFTKRVDEASPLIAKALTMNQVVEATFDFFRNDPNSGVTLHYYTVQLTGGRISSIEMASPDASVVSESTSLMFEKIGIVFHTIIWRNVEKGTEHQDEWSKS